MDAPLPVGSRFRGPQYSCHPKGIFFPWPRSSSFASSRDRGGVATGVGGASLCARPSRGGRGGAKRGIPARARERRPQVRGQDGGGGGGDGLRDGGGAGAGGGGRVRGAGPQLSRQPAGRGAGVHPVQRLADGRRHRPHFQHLPAAARAVPEQREGVEGAVPGEVSQAPPAARAPVLRPRTGPGRPPPPAACADLSPASHSRTDRQRPPGRRRPGPSGPRRADPPVPELRIGKRPAFGSIAANPFCAPLLCPTLW